jgi:hypothetical protein
MKDPFQTRGPLRSTELCVHTQSVQRTSRACRSRSWPHFVACLAILVYAEADSKLVGDQGDSLAHAPSAAYRGHRESIGARRSRTAADCTTIASMGSRLSPDCAAIKMYRQSPLAIAPQSEMHRRSLSPIAPQSKTDGPCPVRTASQSSRALTRPEAYCGAIAVDTERRQTDCAAIKNASPYPSAIARQSRSTRLTLRRLRRNPD